MPKRGLKFTGFARFFLVLIVAAPVAFVGASYINGEDGIAKLKQFLGLEQEATVIEQPVQPANDYQPTNPAPTEQAPTQENPEADQLRQEVEYFQRRVQELTKENERLKQQLWEKDQELARMRTDDSSGN